MGEEELLGGGAGLGEGAPEAETGLEALEDP